MQRLIQTRPQRVWDGKGEQSDELPPAARTVCVIPSGIGTRCRRGKIRLNICQLSPALAAWGRALTFCSMMLLASFGKSVAQWKQLDVGQSGEVQAVAVIDGNVFAGTYAGIYRSTNGGESWTNVSSVFAYCFAVKGSEIFAGTYTNGVVRSTDGGRTWTQPDSSFNRWVMALAVKDSIIFAGGAGMFRSTDDGASWETIENAMQGSEASVTGLAVDGTKLLASTFSGVMMSTNNGNNWSALVGTGQADQFTNCVAVFDSTVLVGWAGGIIRSTDDGKTWNTINGGIMDTTYPGILVESGSNLIAACQDSGRVFLSSDDGATWKDVGQDLPELASLAVSGSYVFAGSYDGMFRSSDNGETWDKISDTLIDLNALVTDGTHIFAGRYQWPNSTLFPPNPPGGMFVSTDNGGTWVPFGGGHLPDHPQVLSLAIHGSDIFAGLIAESYYSGTLYSSTLDGEMFTDVGQGLPYLNVTRLFVNDSDVYVGTGGGIWARPVSQITAVREPTSPEVPQSFDLEQNYPNPFNPTTTIDYSVPFASRVVLSVYDVLGRRVATLVDSRKSPGRYMVTLNGSNLASGVYFYRLRAGSLSLAKKMIVIK